LEHFVRLLDHLQRILLFRVGGVDPVGDLPPAIGRAPQRAVTSSTSCSPPATSGRPAASTSSASASKAAASDRKKSAKFANCSSVGSSVNRSSFSAVSSETSVMSSIHPSQIEAANSSAVAVSSRGSSERPPSPWLPSSPLPWCCWVASGRVGSRASGATGGR
jgi:hypothetical protein